MIVTHNNACESAYIISRTVFRASTVKVVQPKSLEIYSFMSKTEGKSVVCWHFAFGTGCPAGRSVTLLGLGQL